MRKFLLFITILTLSFSVSFATKYTISAGSGDFVFSPNNTTINAGDTLVFSLASIHNAVEVSKATYDANGSTPMAGGFSVPKGGGQVTLTTPGIHYFVCQPHASMGMKGIINVNSITTGVSSVSANDFGLKISPNPASDYLKISYYIESVSFVNLNLFDAVGNKLANITSEYRGIGVHEETYAIKNLKPGVYFISLSNDNNRSIVKKLIIR